MVSSQAAYCVGLASLGLERLFELALSKRNAARAFSQGAVEHGARHFRAMSAFHTLFLICCGLEVLLLHRPFRPVLGYLCLCLALAAQALRYWAVTTLGERWNVRVIVLPGTNPVTHGPYRFIRHPNYVAVVIEMACVPMIHGAWLSALVFSAGNAILLWVRIRSEEAALGSPYALTFNQKPRFIPQIRR